MVMWKSIFAWVYLFGIVCGIPSIVEEPQNQEILQGEDVVLRCVVDEIPLNVQNPVQWTKGNFALGNDRDLILICTDWDRYSMVGDVTKGEYYLKIRDSLVTADDNVYECQVTSYELRSRQAKLTVLVPPSGPYIDGANENEDITIVNVVVGKENEITCHAMNGKPAARLQWFRGNKEVFAGVELVMSSPVDKLYNVSSTLRITPTFGDADVTYDCVMSSDAIPSMEPKRKTVKLNLLEPPKVSVHIPEAIRDGEYVEAQCRSYADPPVTLYRWYWNGILQPEETTSIFSLGLVNKTWRGVNIGCEAKNAAGYSERNVQTLSVLYSPIFIDGTDKIDADIGQNVTLRCNWDSNPEPVIRWFYGNSETILGRGSELHLVNVDQTYSGEYHCRATANQVGENTATTELIVYGPPIFDHEKTQYAVLGKDAQISCSLGSYPGIKQVTWSWIESERQVTLQDNETGPSADGKVNNKFQSEFEPDRRFAQLRILKVTEDDLHSYTCLVEVENNYGELEADIILEKDTSRAHQMLTLTATIGVAAGIAVLVISLLLLAWCCLRSRRQQKSMNFDKVSRKTLTHSIEMDKQRAFEQDETIAVNVNEAKSGAYNVRSSSVSSHGVGGSSESETDGVNPPPPTAQDDGYHTEEANSWNRNHENPDKAEVDSVSSSQKISHPFMDYVVDLPPVPESADYKQPLLNGPENEQYSDHPPRPMSVNRYPYDQSGPPHAPTYRSTSALGGRYSPAVGFDPRLYPDNIPASMYSQIPYPQAEYYPPNSVYTTLQPIAEPMFVGSPFSGRSRLTPVSVPMTSFDRYDQVASQSSLDNFERESALSSSIIPSRTIGGFENNPGRNLHSRLSQSSKSSEFNRPLVARMATHV